MKTDELKNMSKNENFENKFLKNEKFEKKWSFWKKNKNCENNEFFETLREVIFSIFEKTNILKNEISEKKTRKFPKGKITLFLYF